MSDEYRTPDMIVDVGEPGPSIQISLPRPVYDALDWPERVTGPGKVAKVYQEDEELELIAYPKQGVEQ